LEFKLKRKIIKQGHNTLTITLPSAWVKRFNLEAGKEIDLIEKNNGLFISTEKNNDEKRTEFNITDMDTSTIWKYFMAVYREGYDEVLVKFDPKMKLENPYKFFTQHRLDLRYGKETQKRNIVSALQGFVSRFIGFEIVEHGKDFILIKEMGDLTSKEFDNSLRRIFLLLQDMAETTFEAIIKNDRELVVNMHDVDINLDKFHDYCIRILNKIGNKEPRKSELLFSTLYLLEMIGDEFKQVAHHLLQDFPKAKFDNVKKLAELVKEQLDIYCSLFYKFDLDKVKQISNTDKTVYLSVSEMYKKTSNNEKEVFHHWRVIQRFINALVELRIEMEF
tara:strand:- start:998 stop:1999 length:1002 start_codon:yes stop_codon:yes gene_type:complete